MIKVERRAGEREKRGDKRGGGEGERAERKAPRERTKATRRKREKDNPAAHCEFCDDVIEMIHNGQFFGHMTFETDL